MKGFCRSKAGHARGSRNDHFGHRDEGVDAEISERRRRIANDDLITVGNGPVPEEPPEAEILFANLPNWQLKFNTIQTKIGGDDIELIPIGLKNDAT